MVGITHVQFLDFVLEKNVTRNAAKFAIFIEEKTQKVFFFFKVNALVLCRHHGIYCKKSKNACHEKKPRYLLLHKYL